MGFVWCFDRIFEEITFAKLPVCNQPTLSWPSPQWSLRFNCCLWLFHIDDRDTPFSFHSIHHPAGMSCKGLTVAFFLSNRKKKNIPLSLVVVVDDRWRAWCERCKIPRTGCQWGAKSCSSLPFRQHLWVSLPVSFISIWSFGHICLVVLIVTSISIRLRHDRVADGTFKYWRLG